MMHEAEIVLPWYDAGAIQSGEFSDHVKLKKHFRTAVHCKNVLSFLKLHPDLEPSIRTMLLATTRPAEKTVNAQYDTLRALASRAMSPPTPNRG